MNNKIFEIVDEEEEVFVSDDAHFKHECAYQSVRTLTLKNGTLTLNKESWANGENTTSSARRGVLTISPRLSI